MREGGNSSSSGSRPEGQMDIGEVTGEVKGLAVSWINEVVELTPKDGPWEELYSGAWDDVRGGDLPVEKVREARNEEIKFMQSKGIWEVVPTKECWEKTGSKPVSVRWVDTNKGGAGEMIVRSRLVARDFKGNDKGRDDLFAETPPLEALRLLLSRAATRRRDGGVRKLLFIDVRKAHLNPICEEDVYVELPAEVGESEGKCGKLKHWLYGFRPAAAAWEKCIRDCWKGKVLLGEFRVEWYSIIRSGTYRWESMGMTLPSLAWKRTLSGLGT